MNSVTGPTDSNQRIASNSKQLKMPSAECQVNYEDLLVAEDEQGPDQNEAMIDEDIEDDSDDDSRFDSCVSLIYKVEMEDKKGTDFHTISRPLT